MTTDGHRDPSSPRHDSSASQPLDPAKPTLSRNLVSLVVPFYNEEEAVETFFRTLRPVMDNIAGVEFEVVCIDDGSGDATLARLCDLVERDPRFRVIELSRNFGKEAALTAGIEAARGDAVIPMDGDLQDPPELIPAMIEAWQQGAEVVVARRVDRSSDSFLKRKTASLFYRFHNRLADVPLPENVGDFRLLDRVALEALKTLPERQRFMKGLFAWVGFKTVTIDYRRRTRTAGNSKFSGWKLWNFAIEGITSFSTVPLKMWTYIGTIGALFTSCYAVYIVVRTLLYGVDVPGYASLLVAILFLGSLQLISIGILGEYIGRIYMESKNRP
ncbi:MAG: glycosyltransferase family 2 protein, partial [Desulfobulbaceae bacterium]|nr:glycosyltransferase family 2 protein [Desulfobulbaceae bacterium]